MKVRAKEKCFAGGSIRYADGKVFDFEQGVDPQTGKDFPFPKFLEIVDKKAKMPAPKDDNYASLSDDAIRSKLTGYTVKVPRLAKRKALIVLLANAEGKTTPKKENKE